MITMDITFENIRLVIDIVAYTIATASIVVKMTPSLKDDAIMEKIVKFFKMISLNVEDKKLEITVK